MNLLSQISLRPHLPRSWPAHIAAMKHRPALHYASPLILLLPIVFGQAQCAESAAFTITDQQSASSYPACNDDPQCVAIAGNFTKFVLSAPARDIEDPRIPLLCTTSEDCFLHADILFCLDTSTGAYHDTLGGQGNVLKGAAEQTQNATMTSASRTQVSTITQSGSTVVQVITVTPTGPNLQPSSAARISFSLPPLSPVIVWLACMFGIAL